MSSNQDKQYSISAAIYIGGLLFKHADGQVLSDKEQADLDEWAQSTPQRRAIFAGSTDRLAIAAELRRLKDQYDTEKAIANIFNALNLSEASPEESGISPERSDDSPEWSEASPERSDVSPERRLRRLYYPLRWLAAAILTGAIALSAWFYIFHSRQIKSPIVKLAPPGKDILPGSSKAVLTLGDGEIIALDKTKNGQLARQGNVTIISKDGRLTYQGAENAGKMVYNTITTPKGGQYQLILPDGSRVWLNAASSIKYPTSFTGAQRKVELTGEAYFEIAQNKQHPFIVQTRETTVSVLGTDFDMMAYQDEDAQRTTLLKGSVLVSQGAQSKLLTPGQQAIVKPERSITVDPHVDIEKAVAWKTGFFVFNNTDIKILMREISRWYDIEVVYETTDFSGEYGGRISRNNTLLQTKELLEGNGIHHYRIEGRKLFVLP